MVPRRAKTATSTGTGVDGAGVAVCCREGTPDITVGEGIVVVIPVIPGVDSFWS
jgi:hypothetical protein